MMYAISDKIQSFSMYHNNNKRTQSNIVLNLGIIQELRLLMLPLNDVGIRVWTVRLTLALKQTQNGTSKDVRDGKVDEEVDRRVERDEEIGDLSNRTLGIRFIDVANVENQREQSIGKVAANEASDDNDQTHC